MRNADSCARRYNVLGLLTFTQEPEARAGDINKWLMAVLAPSSSDRAKQW